MKRPKQHQIDTDAKKIYESAISSEHSNRRQEDDYGIDYEIEVFEGGATTGFIFKVQLKGTDGANYSEDNTRISYHGFEMDNAHYLIEEIEIPAAIVIVDTLTKQAFWTPVQSNRYLLDDYKAAKQKGNESLTVKFSTKNVLPNTWLHLLSEMTNAANLLALKRAANVPPSSYSQYLENLEDITAELIQLHSKIDFSMLKQIIRLLDKNDVEQVKRVISEVMVSKDRSLETKFQAILLTEQVYARESRGQVQIDGYDKANFYLWRAEELMKIGLQDKPDGTLHYLAGGYYLAAKFQHLVFLDFQLYVNWQVQQSLVQNEEGFVETLWYNMLPFERTKVVKALTEVLSEIKSYLAKLITRHEWEYIPDFTTSIVWELIIFLTRLKHEGLANEAQIFENWICAIINFTLKLSYQLVDKEQAEVIQKRLFLQYLRLIDTSKNDADTIALRKKDAETLINGITDKDLQKDYRKELKRVLNEVKKVAKKPKPTNWDAVENHYRQQAQALGVDLSLANQRIGQEDKRYSDSRIAWIIDIGIRDVNPTRILKNCKYLVYRYWEHGGIGAPALMLGLHSARMKRIGCIKHPEHGTSMNYSLDELYASFYQQHCKHCSDCVPQPPEWEYSESWHHEHIQKWEAIELAYRNSKKNSDD